MAELLVRGGTLVDGTGAAPGRRRPHPRRPHRRGGARPAARGRSPARRRRCATSRPASSTATPISTRRCSGTRRCDPMPQHGVTTVLVGNCSLGLVPCGPSSSTGVPTFFCYIEDMPRVAFAVGIPWTWERYPEYRDALGRGGLGVNAVVLLGHSVLRIYVMGADAWERAATADERAADRVACSTSRWPPARSVSRLRISMPTPRAGRCRAAWPTTPNATRWWRFWDGTGGARRVGGQPAGRRRRTAAEGAGRVVRTARGGEHHECARARRSRVRTMAVRSWLSPASCVTGAVRSGRRCRRAPSTSESTGRSSMVFMMYSEWHRIPNAADDDERARLLRDPEWRAPARARVGRDSELPCSRHITPTGSASSR